MPSVSLEVVLTFGAWLGLNIGLNYYNRWLLGFTNFRFPFLLTMTNKAVGLMIALGIMSTKQGFPKPNEVTKHFRRPIVHIQGIATALNIGLNNWSLALISLTMNQIIKSTAPLPTALLSVLIEGKSYSWQLYGSMAVLIAGCALAAAGAFGDDEPIAGIIICIGSVVSSAVWTVTSAVVMQMGEEPLDAVSLLFVSGPTCILTLFCFFCGLELPQLIEFDASDLPSVEMMVLYLAIAAGIASVYDIVHNQFVKLTSAVNMSIMGNSKLALLVLLSMLTLERPPTEARIAGVTVAFLGVVWYAVFKLYDVPAPKPKVGDSDKAEPLAASDGAAAASRPTEASALLKP